MHLYKAMDLLSLLSGGRLEQIQFVVKALSQNASTAAFSRPGSYNRPGSLSHSPGLTSQNQPSGLFFALFHTHWLVLVREDSIGYRTFQ